MLPFRTSLIVTAAVLALSGAGLASAPAVPRFDDFPGDTAQVADRQLFFETNLGLIERATTEAVDQALEGLKLPPGSDILLHSVINNEGSWFVEDFIARRLNQRGYNVHVPKEIPPGGQTASAPPAAPAPATGSTPTAAAAGGAPPSLSDATRAAERPKPAATGADSTQSASPKAPSTPDPAGTAAGGTGSGNLTDAVVSATPADSAGPGGATHGRTGQYARRDGPKNGPKNVDKTEQEELIPVPEGQGLVLTIRLVEFGVTYHDSWRRGFMGPRLVERLASVNLYCRLVSDGPQNVLWVGRGKSERLDVVPKSKLDLLEGLSYPFTKPALRPERFSRLLEPVLVTGIIGGLVYLFYTNQE